MDFEFRYTTEQQAFRQEVRSWLDDNIPVGVRWPNDAKNMPHEIWQWVKTFREQLGAKGWLHATYPKEYGGGGLSAEHDVVLQEELERQDIPIDGLKFHDNQNDLPALMVWGTEEQKQNFLVSRLRGEKIAWQLFTEPGAGSDLASLKTRAVKDGDDWVITGEKVFVGGDSGYADPDTKTPDELQMGYLFCLAITDPNAPRHRNMGYFYIPGETPGITAQTLDLLVGHGKRQIYLDNVRVSSDNVIGGETQGWQVTQTTLEIEHGGGGGATQRERTLSKVINHLREAEVTHDEHLKQILMDAYIDTEQVRLFGVRNYWMYDTKQEMTFHGSQFALLRKESALRVADAIREVCNLSSLLDFRDEQSVIDGEMELHQRETLAAAHPGGTIEVQKVIVARRLGVSRTKERAAPTPATMASEGNA
jgi:alkylation response protein AidB-like acyl-CoA dehydrogenase